MPTLFILWMSLLAYTPPAQALIEVHLHYGINSVNPEGMNNYLSELMATKTHNLLGFGIDALVILPDVPLGFGVRYEQIGNSESRQDATVGVYSYETGYSRIAMLVNHRILDSDIYFGPLAGIGITNSVYFNENRAGSTRNYKTVGGTSLSTAIEGGGKFGSLILGGEVGYTFAHFKTPKADAAKLVDLTGREVPLNFDGPFAKLHVGAHF